MPLSAAKKLLLFNRPYSKKLLNLFGSSIVGYWKQGEPSGAVSVDSGPRNHPGAYTAVTLGQPGMGDGGTAASYNGTSASDNIGTNGMPVDFNGLEGTLAIWVQVANVGVWTDATARDIVSISVDGTTKVEINRDGSANSLTFQYNAGGVSKSNNVSGQSSVGFLHLALTWSKSGDALIRYINGVQQGATVTGLGTWVGVPATTRCFLGARLAANDFWSGLLAHAVLCNIAHPASVIAQTATVP